MNVIVPVILCGGSGTRLWPLSRRATPKQLLPLTGAASMLRQTLDRLGRSDVYGDAIVVGAAEHGPAIMDEIRIDDRLILEPTARNTTAAVALAALNLPRSSVMLVLPSDHVIADTAAFDAAVLTSLPFACAGWIITFGMTPTRPDTGYGYIQRGRKIGDGVFAVERFVEKPDADTAREYLLGGEHDWNGGMFMMRADTLIEGLERHAPEILAAVRNAVDAQEREGRMIRPDSAVFETVPSAAIDYALMEKADNIAVVPVTLGWSDIGSWSALHEVSEQDEGGNAVSGNVLAIDAERCLIRSEGLIVTAIGVSDLIVIATAEAVLVVPRDQSQRVKEIVDGLRSMQRIDLI